MAETSDEAFAQRARAIADEESGKRRASRAKAKSAGAANGVALPTLQEALGKATPEVADALRDGIRIAQIQALTPPGFEAFAEACLDSEGTSPEQFAVGVMAIIKGAGGANAVTAEHVARGADHHRWQTNPGIRAEFRNEEAYLGYQAGVRSGRIRGGRKV